MAELGDIRFNDVNRGTRTVDRSGEARALGGILDTTKNVINEAAKADLRGDLEMAQQQALLQAEAESQEPTFNEFQTEAYGGNEGPTVTFVNQMRKHQAMANQATSVGTRNRAILLMQQELTSAKSKYGWLRAELDAEASRFMSTSPVLTAMGLADASTNAGAGQSAISADWVQGIKDDAKRLGIDPRLTYGSPAFARQYNKKRDAENKRIALAEQAAIVVAEDVVEVRAIAEVSRAQLDGPNGGLTAFYDKFTGPLTKMNDAKRNFELGNITETQLNEIQAQYYNGVQQDLVTQLVRTRMEMRDEFNQLWRGRFSDSDEYKAEKARLDAHIEDLETIEGLIETGDVTEIGILMNAQREMRGHALLDNAPVLRQFEDLAVVTQKSMQAFVAMNLDFSSKWAMGDITNGMVPEMEKMFESVLSDHVVVNGEDTVDGRRRARANARNRSNSPGGRIETNDPTVIAADEVDRLYRIQRQAATPELQDPTSAALNLGSYAKSFQTLASAYEGLDNLDTDEKAQLRLVLADPAIVTNMDLAGRGSPTVRDLIFGIENDVQTQLDPTPVWREEIVAQASQTVGRSSGPALEYLDIDTSQLLEAGQVTFTVNEEAVNAALPIPDAAVTETTVVSAFGLRTVSENRELERAKWIRELEATAENLTREATNYTRVQAHHAYGKNPNATSVQYGLAWAPSSGNGMDAIFKVMDDVSNGN